MLRDAMRSKAAPAVIAIVIFLVVASAGSGVAGFILGVAVFSGARLLQQGATPRRRAVNAATEVNGQFRRSGLPALPPNDPKHPERWIKALHGSFETLQKALSAVELVIDQAYRQLEQERRELGLKALRPAEEELARCQFQPSAADVTRRHPAGFEVIDRFRLPKPLSKRQIMKPPKAAMAAINNLSQNVVGHHSGSSAAIVFSTLVILVSLGRHRQKLRRQAEALAGEVAIYRVYVEGAVSGMWTIGDQLAELSAATRRAADDAKVAISALPSAAGEAREDVLWRLYIATQQLRHTLDVAVA